MPRIVVVVSHQLLILRELKIQKNSGFYETLGVSLLLFSFSGAFLS